MRLLCRVFERSSSHIKYIWVGTWSDSLRCVATVLCGSVVCASAEPEGVASSKHGLYGLIAAVSGGGGQARELNACVRHGIACCALCLKTQLVRVPRRKAKGAAARAARVVHGAWRSWEATLTSC